MLSEVLAASFASKSKQLWASPANEFVLVFFFDVLRWVCPDGFSQNQNLSSLHWKESLFYMFMKGVGILCVLFLWVKRQFFEPQFLSSPWLLFCKGIKLIILNKLVYNLWSWVQVPLGACVSYQSKHTHTHNFCAHVPMSFLLDALPKTLRHFSNSSAPSLQEFPLFSCLFVMNYDIRVEMVSKLPPILLEWVAVLRIHFPCYFPFLDLD